MASTDTTKEHLLHVIQGCLGDLETKLKALVMADSIQDEDEIKRVREFVARLTEQSAIIEVEEVLPKILEYLQQSKNNQASAIIGSVMNRQRDRMLRSAWFAIVNLAV
jgi:hypothetical protein